MIVRFNGGLGNQLFQYAFYESLKSKYPNRDIKCDLSTFETYKTHNGYELEKIFNLRLPLTTSKEKKHINRILTYRNENIILSYFMRASYDILLKRIIIDKECGYTKDIFNRPSKKAIYCGYWQDEKYFLNVKDKVRSSLQFEKPKDEQNKKVVEEMENTNSISVHIRRGDYLKFSDRYINLCNTNYYHNAIEYIKKNIKNPRFFVFSDDIDWVKHNLELPSDSVFVDWNKGEDSFIDMQLMSYCKHNIIANSTFSWWGAWLNNSPNKMVLCPSQFICKKKEYNKGIICDGWLTIQI